MKEREEYRIIEDKIQFEGALNNEQLLNRTMKREREFFIRKTVERRKNIRAGKPAMEGLLTDNKVKALLELGEINYKQAIRLDFFSSLDIRLKVLYAETMLDIYERKLQDYFEIKNQFCMAVTDFDTMGMFASSAISRAKVWSEKKSVLSDLNKKQINTLCRLNYNESLRNFDNDMIMLNDFIVGNACRSVVSIPRLNQQRKELARDVAGVGRTLDLYHSLLADEGGLFYYSSVKALRNSSVSRDIIKEANNCRKYFNQKNCQGYELRSSEFQQSKLVVLDDEKNAQERM